MRKNKWTKNVKIVGDACTHPDADWEVETIRDENDLIVRYEFDKSWDKLTSGQGCDLFEELE